MKLNEKINVLCGKQVLIQRLLNNNLFYIKRLDMFVQSYSF